MMRRISIFFLHALSAVVVEFINLIGAIRLSFVIHVDKNVGKSVKTHRTVQWQYIVLKEEHKRRRIKGPIDENGKNKQTNKKPTTDIATVFSRTVFLVVYMLIRMSARV